MIQINNENDSFDELINNEINLHNNNNDKLINISKIINKTNEEFYKKNEEYYNDVLLLLNILFTNKSSSILKIFVKYIDFSESIILLYNSIINKYKLSSCPPFDVNKFDFSKTYSNDFIYDVVFILVNNLLKEINYEMIKIKIDKKTKFKLRLKKNN